MEEDIKILEEMRDNIYGAIQFEDDYEVRRLEEKQFNALNLAIKSIERYKELEKANKIYVKIVRSWRERIKEIIYPSPENPIELEIQNSKMYKELEKLVED